MKITDSVYALESTKGAYAYIIRGNETILVDTGFPWSKKGILRELEAMGIELKQIKHILLTHYDIDHVGNAALLQELTGADVWASEEDAPVIMGTADRKGFKKYFKYLFNIKKPKDVKTFAPDAEIDGVKVVPTPGHTPGHVCLLYDGVLFAGDLVENKKGKLIPYPKGWNWDNAALLKSFDKVARIPFKWVCPAHGSPVERGNQLLYNG